MSAPPGFATVPASCRSWPVRVRSPPPAFDKAPCASTVPAPASTSWLLGPSNVTAPAKVTPSPALTLSATLTAAEFVSTTPAEAVRLPFTSNRAALSTSMSAPATDPSNVSVSSCPEPVTLMAPALSEPAVNASAPSSSSSTLSVSTPAPMSSEASVMPPSEFTVRFGLPSAVSTGSTTIPSPFTSRTFVVASAPLRLTDAAPVRSSGPAVAVRATSSPRSTSVAFWKASAVPVMSASTSTRAALPTSTSVPVIAP